MFGKVGKRCQQETAAVWSKKEFLSDRWLHFEAELRLEPNKILPLRPKTSCIQNVV